MISPSMAMRFVWLSNQLHLNPKKMALNEKLSHLHFKSMLLAVSSTVKSVAAGVTLTWKCPTVNFLWSFFRFVERRKGCVMLFLHIYAFCISNVFVTLKYTFFVCWFCDFTLYVAIKGFMYLSNWVIGFISRWDFKSNSNILKTKIIYIRHIYLCIST